MFKSVLEVKIDPRTLKELEIYSFKRKITLDMLVDDILTEYVKNNCGDPQEAALIQALERSSQS